MENKKNFLILLGILILLIAGGLAAYRSLSDHYELAQAPVETPSVETIAAAPQETASAETEEVYYAMDFTLLDNGGNEVSLSDFYGKPIVLNFWATWCGPCKSELPTFDALAAEYADEVVFMMVNLTDGSRETVESVQNFLAEEGYTFPVYYDTQLAAANTYGAYSIPTTVFIYPDTTIYGGYIGAMNEELLRSCIEAIR